MHNASRLSVFLYQCFEHGFVQRVYRSANTRTDARAAVARTDADTVSGTDRASVTRTICIAVARTIRSAVARTHRAAVAGAHVVAIAGAHCASVARTERSAVARTYCAAVARAEHSAVVGTHCAAIARTDRRTGVSRGRRLPAGRPEELRDGLLQRDDDDVRPDAKELHRARRRSVHRADVR